MDIYFNDVLLLTFSSTVAFIILYFFFAIQFECSDIFYLENDNSFVYEYKNNFGIKRYYKRGVEEAKMKKIKISEFKKNKINLVRLNIF